MELLGRCQGLNVATSLSPISHVPSHHKSNTVSSVGRANKKQYYWHTPTGEQRRINYQLLIAGISKEYHTTAASLRHHDRWVCKHFFLCIFHLNEQKLIFQSRRCTLVRGSDQTKKTCCSCLTAETLRERDYRGSSYATVVSYYMLYSWLFKLVSSCV